MNQSPAPEAEDPKWSRGALEVLSSCPACGAQGACWDTRRVDDAGAMPDIWHIYRCSACGSIYLNPRPDAESLPAAYVDYLTHDAPEAERALASQGWMWAVLRDYLASRFGLRTPLRVLPGGRVLFQLFEPWRLKLDRFGRHLTRSRFLRPGRLLDVGCGAGEFLALAKAMGWSASGCDPDPKVVEMCIAGGLDVRLGGGDAFADALGSFDVVTLNQVIEHVIDPQALLRQCQALLRPGGMVWIGFPNPRSIGFMQFGAAWAGLHPPYHLCLPTQAVLGRWLVSAGFERVHFERRGMHARADWQKSVAIARQLGLVIPRPWSRWLSRCFSDFVSTLTPRWSEETVAVAWKAAH